MALILRGKTQCSICGVVIKDGDPIVSTTHFIVDENHPLWRFSDSGMHKSCFLAWPLRETFVERYNATIGSVTWGNGTYHNMEPDGDICVLNLNAEL